MKAEENRLIVKKLAYKLALLGSLLAILAIPSISQINANERAQWFTDERFGMFIHRGVCSGAEGIRKGEELRYDNNYAEWIYYRSRIARDEYTTLLDRFDWEKIDPGENKKIDFQWLWLDSSH